MASGDTSFDMAAATGGEEEKLGARQLGGIGVSTTGEGRREVDDEGKTGRVRSDRNDHLRVR